MLSIVFGICSMKPGLSRTVLLQDKCYQTNAAELTTFMLEID
jgi:hypothetical protein